ncbi:hypothetical protein CMUS01_06975 [Colletotrichum musicola]|uniref:Uncharacterized protein n=1 Tax=Colletotrichum musicola TaxID=2175873 RepID=A0A8H6NGS8_9PEZI|nr:hypothetical protein CMUS01_06975 [Colletotrichum musicola]
MSLVNPFAILDQPGLVPLCGKEARRDEVETDEAMLRMKRRPSLPAWAQNQRGGYGLADMHGVKASRIQKLSLPGPPSSSIQRVPTSTSSPDLEESGHACKMPLSVGHETVSIWGGGKLELAMIRPRSDVLGRIPRFPHGELQRTTTWLRLSGACVCQATNASHRNYAKNIKLSLDQRGLRVAMADA